MGWSNPPIPWSELERKLSDQRRPGGAPPTADGGDSPAWSRKRAAVRAARADSDARRRRSVPYAELHATPTSASSTAPARPEQLLEEAERLGLHALALTDHDGFYGVVRLAEAAESYPSVQTVFGAELSLGLSAPQNGVADPEGSHLLVLARGEEGYHRLAAAITARPAARRREGPPGLRPRRARRAGRRALGWS